MQMESENERFYRDLAGKASDPGITHILTMLADDEAKHYRIVKSMSENAEPEMAETTILADAKRVFGQMTAQAFDLEGTQVDLYRQAQELERRSHEFYGEQADQTAAAAAGDLLRKIADEEKRHISLLGHVIEFVNRPDTWLEDAEFTHLEEY
jgi:rubrerythrin